ncbi:hypothetical protein GGS20DRAFT_563911 [Poronia punctata]|nr:hypothetical protein GGS20DRAFT_563911 [Poronia punctata]
MNNSNNTPNRDRQPPASSMNTGHDDATYKTALKGASIAFQKKPPNPPKSSTAALPARQAGHGSNNGNGALIAATSASRDHNRSQPLSTNQVSSANTISHQSTGRSSAVTHSALLSTGQTNLAAPTKASGLGSRSPSFIAATLAASRSASPSPKPTPTVYPKSQQIAARGLPRGSAENDDSASFITELDLTADLSSIAPANALISLFERKSDERDPVKKSSAAPTLMKGVNVKSGLRPMTPPRATEPVLSLESSPSRLAANSQWEGASPSQLAMERHAGIGPQPQRKSTVVDGKKRPPTPPPTRAKSDAKPRSPEAGLKKKGKPRAITPPPTIRRSSTVIVSPQPWRISSQKLIEATSVQIQRSEDHSPNDSLEPPFLLRRSSTTLSNDTFVSASSAPSAEPSSPARKSPPQITVDKSQSSVARSPTHSSSAHNVRPAPSPRPRLSTQRSSNLGLESLTNAIVAGSLASSRAAPRSAQPPTPPPRQPTPRIRQTLRAPRTQSEEEVAKHHGKKPLGKLSSRKKHSHHEGSRKRWREEITQSERQRYEGVWASNRGLLLDELSAAANGLRDVDKSLLIPNVVVRDIWSRSRLPFDELAEVWDLVDIRKKGVLDKVEFVVGMWLIDQRLRGRKIPPKVSDSVWGSAKGVSVLGHHKHHHKHHTPHKAKKMMKK